MTGQRCLGSDNVVAIGDIYDELKERFIDIARAMKLGYGLDESVTLGPYTTAAGRDKVQAWIDLAVSEGATLALDGRTTVPPTLKGGYFMGLTILENMHIDMSAAKEEAFGAVAGLIRAEKLDDVIDMD